MGNQQILLLMPTLKILDQFHIIIFTILVEMFPQITNVTQ